MGMHSRTSLVPRFVAAVLQELKTKKRYGRLQKAMGDHCLLAGSPLDAQDHYSTGGWVGGGGRLGGGG
jgi:hypothetical protein